MLAVLAISSAATELLVDTGESLVTGKLPISSGAPLHVDRSFVAAQVSFDTPVEIDTISIYILAPFPPDDVDDTLTVSIVNDNTVNLPGEEVLASITTLIDSLLPFAGWISPDTMLC